jgi:uncharacterized protein with ParB-like and HNH nuclease domain
MDSSTTIRNMLYGNKICVPNYQRAYSWETPLSSSDTSKTHTDVFLKDLENYIQTKLSTPYYFGHFLFEERDNNKFDVIDGQQRLTTIVIFLCALFAKIKTFRKLSDDEELYYENMIKKGKTYFFSTVDYDNQFFQDYVIDQNTKNKNHLETESAKRIAKAFDYFCKKISNKDKDYLNKMLQTIIKAACTTHLVRNEAEAIQMFIFQNNRGKKPTNLEIIKAQFMYVIHLYGGNEKDELIEEIKNRFEKIYKSISTIEHHVDEDSVLLYTLRVYFNSLWEDNAIERINEQLIARNPVKFIVDFSRALSENFDSLTVFYGKDEKQYFEIHSLVTLGGIGIVIPFIIKMYIFGLDKEEICKFCSCAESLVLRHRLIGTRAYIESRLSEVYQNFEKKNPDITPIIEKINWMKKTKNNWWAYWNTTKLKDSIGGKIDVQSAKYILWKYENHLHKSGKKGYAFKRYGEITSPELEHIAPQTPTNNKPISAGYCEYDEEFVNEYIDCLGNYLLLSKSHNCSVGNKPFSEKRNSYKHLLQQLEVKEMTKGRIFWDKNTINKRHEKIVKYIIENL